MRTSRRRPSFDRLKSVDQFRKCTKAQLREVERLAEHVKVEQGEILVSEGQPGRELFLILAGTVEVAQTGRRVNTLGPCDFFGELAALCRGNRNATVTALSDLELLVIGPRELNAMAQIPGFRDSLLKRMASRLRVADARLAGAEGQEAVGNGGTPGQGSSSTSFTSLAGANATEVH